MHVSIVSYWTLFVKFEYSVLLWMVSLVAEIMIGDYYFNYFFIHLLLLSSPFCSLIYSCVDDGFSIILGSESANN